MKQKTRKRYFYNNFCQVNLIKKKQQQICNKASKRQHRRKKKLKFKNVKRLQCDYLIHYGRRMTQKFPYIINVHKTFAVKHALQKKTSKEHASEQGSPK